MQNSKILQFNNEYHELCKSIASSNGAGYYASQDLRPKVGIITDPMQFDTFSSALDLEYLSYVGYHEQIDSSGYQFVFYISCWKGMGVTNEYNGPSGVLKATEVIMYARSLGIPTVFYSREDPVEYQKYLPIAQAADVIFTTCSEVVDDYRHDTNNDHVFVLEYGINPLVHNPIGLLRRHSCGFDSFLDTILFAGSWYERWPERCASMQMMLTGILASKTKVPLIIDRNYYLDYEHCKFPSEYASHIVPTVDYLELQKASKLFDFSLNLNIVTDSATMCAVRVYEMQALGVLLVSNYALALSKNFPGIFTPLWAEEVGRIIDGYTPDEVLSMQLEGIREVFSGRTVFDRLNTVFSAVGLAERFEEKGVLILCGEVTAEARADFEAQTYAAHRLVDLSSSGPDALVALPSEGYCVLLGSGRHDRHFLEDLVNAHKFTDVGYTSFATWEEKEGAYEYVEGPVPARDALFDLRRASAQEVAAGQTPVGLLGFKVLAPHYGRDTSSTEKRLAVIMPVYNNGVYLKGRSFRSLLRSSVFNQMRVYLIDDGSTDGETPQAVAEIADAHDNVEAFYFADGDSGSASRARNKGLVLAQEPLVTFLDPDNEAVGDGYARLLAAFDAEPDLTLIAGGNVKLSAKDTHEPGHSLTCAPIPNSWESLLDHKFMPVNCQAMVIRRDYLVKNDICYTGDRCLREALTTLSTRDEAFTANMRFYDFPVVVHYNDILLTLQGQMNDTL